MADKPASNKVTIDKRWATIGFPEQELQRQLHDAVTERTRFESEWRSNEEMLLYVGNNGGMINSPSATSSQLENPGNDPDNSDTFVNSNYLYRNATYVHSLISANPPAVLVRPNSSTAADKNSAEAAHKLVRYGERQYSLQERKDSCALNTLFYGWGATKGIWDAQGGVPIDADDEGNITMSGDMVYTTPRIWDLYLDATATCLEEVRHVFERFYLPYSEAISIFGPEYEDILKAAKVSDGQASSQSHGNDSSIYNRKYDMVELYEYWEKGSPSNGFQGRFCTHTKTGKILGDISKSPHRFKIGPNKKLMVAKLPYHIFQYYDMPNTPYGRSPVSYSTKLQDTLNRLDATILETIQTLGIPRIILANGAEVNEDEMTDSPIDIIKVSGPGEQPYTWQAASTSQDTQVMREQLKQGIDDAFGVNESMLGQQSRETSGFNSQYNVSQGNMIRKRLFTKYSTYTQGLYTDYLDMVKKHWKEKKQIKVVGEGKKVDVQAFSGADIESGWDLIIEHGAAFSLDPITRREEIMAMWEKAVEAGVPGKFMLEKMQIADLDGIVDYMKLSQDRMKEVIKDVISTGELYTASKHEDHEGMLAYGMEYIMSPDYSALTPAERKLVDDQMDLLAQMAGPAPAPGGEMAPQAPMTGGPQGLLPPPM